MKSLFHYFKIFKKLFKPKDALSEKRPQDFVIHFKVKHTFLNCLKMIIFPLINFIIAYLVKAYQQNNASHFGMKELNIKTFFALSLQVSS